jgi:murein DD-endopeptidase MepM/ murein hydrolase activator NlpD
MPRRHPFLARNPLDRFLIQFSQFSAFFSLYVKKKIVTFSIYFEKNKNLIVRFFMMKRGRYTRPFLHISAIALLGIGIILSPIVAGTYPVFSQSSGSSTEIASSSNQQQSITVGDNVFSTNISQKPRDKIINYTVQRGDTVTSIAKKFGVSNETIEWQNDLSGDKITPGDTLEVLPVTGVAYKVESGDTIYTIAKDLKSDPQKIVDFPFNDFVDPEKFTLASGTTLIVPDGVKPSAQATYVAPVRPQFVAASPGVSSSLGFIWPISGGISQYYSWYHPGFDITDPIGTPIMAATSGTVSYVSVGTYDTGYGNNVYIDAGNGYRTHYAHMLSVNVSVGQRVSQGQVIGYVGLTGRTTGAHLHFEIYQNGAAVNPGSFLP